MQNWICPSCGEAVPTPFCAACGEQAPGRRHLTLRELARQAAEEVSSIDSRLLRSFRALLVRPGELTAAYVEGRRKPFLGPLQMFLIANALFFAAQPLAHADIFSSPLSSHLQHQDWSGLARRLVAHRLAARGLTMEAFAPLFDQAARLNAKALVILEAAAFFALLPLVFRKARKPLAAHIVFALHVYAFLLLLFCISLALSALDVAIGGGGLASPRVDAALTLFNLAACGVYLYLAVGRAYGQGGAARLLKVAVLTAAVAVLVPGYRFAVFVITLYSV